MHNNTPRRQRNYNTKLNETQVLEIRALADEGVSLRDIAKRYDVCHVTIRDILTGRTWKHVK